MLETVKIVLDLDRHGIGFRSAEDYDSLSVEDDKQCFVEFEAICCRDMTRMISEDTSSNFDRSVQAQQTSSMFGFFK